MPVCLRHGVLYLGGQSWGPPCGAGSHKPQNPLLSRKRSIHWGIHQRVLNFPFPTPTFLPLLALLHQLRCYCFQMQSPLGPLVLLEPQRLLRSLPQLCTPVCSCPGVTCPRFHSTVCHQSAEPTCTLTLGNNFISLWLNHLMSKWDKWWYLRYNNM